MALVQLVWREARPQRAASGSVCRAKQATADAAATLSESTPPDIGIITVESQAAIVERRRPSPSVPKTMAVRSGAFAAKSRMATESCSRARAATWKPSSRNESTPAGQDSIRVHGTWNTVPMETRMERR